MFRKISLFFVIAFVPFFLQAQEDDLIWQKNVNTDFLESAESSCVTPDEQYIVLGCNAKILVLDFMTGEIVKEITEELPDKIKAVDVFKDNNHIAVAGRNFIKFVDIEKGIVDFEITNLYETFDIDYYNVYHIDISPDDKNVAIVFLEDLGETTIEHLVIYNIEGNSFKNISDAMIIRSLKYSNDGKYLSIAKNSSDLDAPGSVILYNTESWQQILLPNSTHTKNVQSVAFSPDNTMLASVGYDGAIKIWNITDNQLIKEINSEGGHPPVWSCVFTQDSKYIFYSNGIELIDYNNLKIWSIENLEFLKECPYPGTSQIFVTSENHYSFLRSASYIYLINPDLKPSDIDELYEKETLLYPNPTNGIVNISLSVPENTYIEANIIDGTGDNIENIFSGKTVSDVFNLSWDSSDYSSGMYWCRIEGSDFMEVYKLVVVK